jgi:hypothetical protein
LKLSFTDGLASLHDDGIRRRHQSWSWVEASLATLSAVKCVESSQRAGVNRTDSFSPRLNANYVKL